MHICLSQQALYKFSKKRSAEEKRQSVTSELRPPPVLYEMGEKLHSLHVIVFIVFCPAAFSPLVSYRPLFLLMLITHITHPPFIFFRLAAVFCHVLFPSSVPATHLVTLNYQWLMLVADLFHGSHRFLSSTKRVQNLNEVHYDETLCERP